MIRPQDLRRFGILLGAASLTGCGALALDHLAAEHANRARNQSARATALAQSQANRADLVAARDAAYDEIDRALALANSPDALLDILSLRVQMDIASSRQQDVERAVARMRAISPEASTSAILSAEITGRADPRAAIAFLVNALRVRPYSEELLHWAGLLELEAGDANAAAVRFGKLIEAAQIRGSDWLASGRIGRAVALSSLEPSRPEAFVEANQLLKASVDEDVQLTVLLLDEFLARGPKFERALRDATDRASAAHVEDIGLGFLKAYVARTSGFPEAALAEIERLLGQSPGERESDLLWLAFQAHMDLDQQAAALVRARRLLEVMPWHMPALYALVQYALSSPAATVDRNAAKKHIDAARAHFEEVRARALESAGRTAEERRARTAEFDRYLASLDAMEQALTRR